VSAPPRERLLLPVLIPVIALGVIGFVLFLFSRILLDVSHTTATVVALLVAGAVMAIAAYVSTREHITQASLWSMAGAVLGVGMLIGGVAMLVGQPGAEEEELFVAQIAAPPDAATVGFEVQTLSGPADEPFTVELRNDDTELHNFTVEADEGGEVLATGPNIAGPGQSANTEVPSLAAGDYFFLCTIHPQTMTGTLTVAEGGGGGPIVVAQDLAFDTDVISLPPDQETELTFDNEDAGVEHNIAIFTDESASEALFTGTIFPGVATQTYTVPALAEGRYYFHCDVHTSMSGTVEVGPPPEGGGGGSGGGEEPPPDG
jgi:plastocyanin